MANSSPAKTSSLEEFIGFKQKTTISYNNLSFLEKLDDNRTFAVWNVLSDYQEELDKIATEVTLSNKEFRKYIYNPKLLAYDIYGSTELFFIILFMNGICSAKEFNMQTIKLLRVNELTEFIEMIYNANKKDISAYNDKMEASDEEYW